MNSQRPYFPFDVIEVPKISYASFNEATACDWNLKLLQNGCKEPNFPISQFFAKVEWQSVKFDVVKETSQNGYGDVYVDGTRVDPIFSFITWTDEYNLWYLYQFIYKSEYITIESFPTSMEVKDIDIQDEVDLKGVHKLTVSFKSVRNNLNYHGAFGLTGCCNPLYLDVPAEECDTNDGGVDNNIPPCDELLFNISESSNSLISNVSGTPSTYTVAWYWRPSETSAWQLIINNASSVSLNQYGIYRAVLTAQQCGQYIDQYLYQNPCSNFDVRIRRSNNYGLIAESAGATTFVWEFNDGTGWTALPDTTAAITATETGDYRVTASNDDCEDQDTYYIVVSDDVCDFNVSIDVDGTTATAVTDADSPTYQWTFEDETGNTPIGTGITVPLTETGIYWLVVSSGLCVKSTYKFYKKPDECQKIEICNWDEMPINQNPTQVTVINNVDACCDDEPDPCPSLTLTITCVNRSLSIQGVPLTGTISWVGPGGFIGIGTPVSFPSSTPSGVFTATVIDGVCTYTANYNYTKPNAGTPVSNPVII
jgi:hypothetical protein